MPSTRHPLISGAGITSLGTLASRILGMVRDMATAALFGLSSGGVMDAFVIAFRIPNLFRRLFAEGALAASYLPIFTALLEQDRRRAWQLASVTMGCLAAFLVGVLLVGEGICGLIWFVWGEIPGMDLLVGLTAVMLPYLLFICLAAQVAATLHALSHFSMPALAPTLLNICWLLGVWAVAPHFAPNQQAQAYALAVAILVAGVLQFAVQLPVLHRFGFRFDFNWTATRDPLGRIILAMGPMLLGLAVTQVNTLLDSLIAWGLAAAPGGPQKIAWLGGVRYPMEQGAAAAIYFGERLYQFPLGILGLAVATAIFPLLSRHAARGDRRRLGDDLTLGLRLVVMLGIPASVGLILLADPLARLLFERGQFTAHDTQRAARMIACYAGGVWAYCALPVLVRGYYALGDRMTPVRLGTLAVGFNLILNLVLIWPLAEAGLAVSTAMAAGVQVLGLAVLFSRNRGPLGWRQLGGTTARTLAATSGMTLATWGMLRHVSPAPGLVNELLRVVVPLTIGAAAYAVVYTTVGFREMKTLWKAFPEDQVEVD